MLKTENISFSVGKKQILKNVSASFLPGEFNMILGPNGSGKSTFLKIFSGEINKFQGIVLYDDKKIKELRKEELAKKRAVMSQQADLGFPLLVEEVVLMGRYPHFTFNPNKKDITICNEVIERMNLVEFKERNYLTLSGGEKQRVQYARVLAQVWEKPTDGYRYLFLDEPLNSLDISYQHEFLQSAVELMKEHTVL
ncbi:MAG TPA: ATP-binding cassette domain-containing protein, partial [Chitinophagaceae bacterium]|nr:ATP-binding cassette domain-containing protein [Chitinophagaceae bacterium]